MEEKNAAFGPAFGRVGLTVDQKTGYWDILARQETKVSQLSITMGEASWGRGSGRRRTTPRVQVLAGTADGPMPVR